MSKDAKQSGQEKHLVGGNNVETKDDDYEIVKLRCPICHESFPGLTDAVRHVLVDEKIAETNHEVIWLMYQQMRLVRCNLCHDDLHAELGLVTSHFAETHHLDVAAIKADPKMYVTMVKTEVDDISDNIVAHCHLVMGRLFPKLSCPWCRFTTLDLGSLLEHARGDHKRVSQHPKLVASFWSSSNWKVICSSCKEEVKANRILMKNHFWKRHKIRMGDVYANVEKHLTRSRAENAFGSSSSVELASYFEGERGPLMQDILKTLEEVDEEDCKEENQDSAVIDFLKRVNEVGDENKESKNDNAKQTENDLTPETPEPTSRQSSRIELKAETEPVVDADVNRPEDRTTVQVDANPWIKDELPEESLLRRSGRKRKTRVPYVDPLPTERRTYDKISIFPLFACPWCPGFRAKYFSQLLRHARRAHGKERTDPQIMEVQERVGDARCNVCGVIGKASLDALSSHFKNHGLRVKDIDASHFTVLKDKAGDGELVRRCMTELRINCVRCGLGFATKVTFFEHVAKSHHEEDPKEMFEISIQAKGALRCALCGLLLENTVLRLEHHLSIVHNERLKKYIVDHGREAILWRSDKFKSLTTAVLECPECLEGIEGTRVLQRHLRLEHEMRSESSVPTLKIAARTAGIRFGDEERRAERDRIKRRKGVVGETAVEEPEIGEEDVVRGKAEELEMDLVLSDKPVANQRDDQRPKVVLNQPGVGMDAMEDKIPKKSIDKQRQEQQQPEQQQQQNLEEDLDLKLEPDEDDDVDVDTVDDDADSFPERDSSAINSADTNTNLNDASEPSEDIEIKDVVTQDANGSKDLVKQANWYDGCKYSCMLCDENAEEFSNMSNLRRHVERRHPDFSGEDDVWLTECRVKEEKTSCRVCGKELVHDRVELSHHAWTEHGMDLAAYQRVERNV